MRKSCFFVIYVLLKRGYEAMFGSLAGRYLANLAVSYCTSLLHSIPSLPFETISTRVTTNKRAEGFLRTSGRIYREGGARGFFAGWV